MKHHSIIYNTVPRETFVKVDELIKQNYNKLKLYLDQLLWWNDRLNLVSRTVPRETIWEHIRHSLLLSQFNCFKENLNIVDAGTGGGLPGFPLAITHPQKHFVLNDVVSKKCLAVKQIKNKLECDNISIFDGLIENIAGSDPFLLVSKHAFNISQLYNMTKHLSWNVMVFYKGGNFDEEVFGISENINIVAHDLSKGDEFYENKALIMVSR